MWDPVELVEIAAQGLRAREAALEAEQAVHGIDALQEVDLHPILADAFRLRGFGVVREAPYPGGKTGRVLRRDRERCDLVLLPAAAPALRDPVAEFIDREAREATLFAAMPARKGTDPEDAYWLEVKVIAQHAYENAIPGPNRAYAGEAARCAGDLLKLSREARARHAGLLILLFADAEETARHDAGAFLERCLQRSIEIASPASEWVRIRERIGNRGVLLFLTPVRAVRGMDEGPVR